MNIIHGLWLPSPGKDFFQSGQFCVWVETEEKTGQSHGFIHPRQLQGEALNEFLLTNLKLAPGRQPAFPQCFIRHNVLLPTCNETPLSSPELRNALDQDEVAQSLSLQAWEVECLPLELPLQAINQIHFLSSFQASETRLGSDFLFWYYLSQSIKQVITKDQYIPGLLQRKGKPKAGCEIYRTWQIVSPGYENLLQQAVKQMPLVCSQRFEPESLLRHFCEVTINELLELANSKTSQSLRKKFTGTLLEEFFESRYLLGSGKSLHAEFEHWHSWQLKINDQVQANGIQLCFRLCEAGPQAPDNWSIQFLAASRQDPVFKQELSAYWALSAKERQALEPLLGADFEHQLLCSLGAAAQIYPRLWQGMANHQPQGVQLNLEQAFEFLKETAWVLEDAGFKVMVPAWWTPKGRQRAKIRLRTGRGSGASSAAASKGLLSLDNLVDYRYELAIGDQPLSPQEWTQLVAAQTPLVQFRGQWMELEPEKMRHMLEFWQQHGDESPQASMPELLKKLAEEDEIFELDQNDSLAAMLAKLADHADLEQIENPQRLNATLRDYQKRGVSWLRYLEQLGLNGCLADDMGLGKTIQVIANLVLVQDEVEAGAQQTGPTLLIAPTSVMGNWQKEVEKFAPQLKTAIHHGTNRLKNAAEFNEFCLAQDMLITSYSLVRKDIKLLEAINWQRIVLDEAQNIKNPKSAQTKAIFKLNARSRLALTGTPVENRLMDLWSIFHFLNPGYLGTQGQFRKVYELPIQQNNNAVKSALLKKLVGPFILRRMKTDENIIKDLPDKVENKLFCNLSKEQAALYETVVRDVEQELAEKEGIERQGLMLSTLMKLKQICNHPMQFLQDGSAFSADRSHKLERIGEMVEEAQADGDSVLIFTQFTEIGEQLVRYFGREKQVNCYYLHGGVTRKKRETMISEFQDPNTGPSVFILSLKAGGVGITLTRANHVFHFDRWWNPAVEDQATDRAFRIGQKKNVFVHKFITMGTLEERIDEMIEEKKQLAGSIVGQDESWLAKLDNDTFKSLIALNKQSVME